MTNTFKLYIIIGVLVAAVAYLIFERTTLAPEPQPAPQQTEREIVTARAREAAHALVTKNQAQLTALIHPTAGVRFSLYGHVDVTRDKKFSREQITQYFNSPVKFTWGEQDGSGTPIIMPLKNFIAVEFADHDYEHAPNVAYDMIGMHSTTINNIKITYTDTRLVQFYFSGFEEKYGGMDWRGIHVVLEKYQGEWFVVGLISDRWTI